MKKFYTHLVEIDSLTVELDSLNLEDHHKHELARLMDENIHNVVMDAILSKLSDEDKNKFAQLVHSDDYDEIWKFLKEKSSDIEEEIRKATKEFKQELHKDLEEAKGKNSG